MGIEDFRVKSDTVVDEKSRLNSVGSAPLTPIVEYLRLGLAKVQPRQQLYWIRRACFDQ